MSKNANAKSKGTTLAIVAAVGIAVAVGLGVFFLTAGSGDESPEREVALSPQSPDSPSEPEEVLDLAHVSTVRFHLSITEDMGVSAYEARFLRGEATVWAVGGTAAKGAYAVDIDVPAGRLAPGDYVVRLMAEGEKRALEAIAAYTFRVEGS